MTKEQLKAKERFVSPRVILAVEIESEDELLAGSPGADFAPAATVTGHETHDEYSLGDYWE